MERQKILEFGNLDFFNLGPKIKDYTQKMTYHLKGIGLSFYLQKIGLIGPQITELWTFLYGHKDIPESLTALYRIGQLVAIFKLGPYFG